MTIPWEYLRVEWSYSTTPATDIMGIVRGEASRPQTWETAYYVQRAGAKIEKLPGDLDWIAFVNGLGAEGWEMISETVRRTLIFGDIQGWRDVRAPIQIAWQFKRPCPAPA